MFDKEITKEIASENKILFSQRLNEQQDHRRLRSFHPGARRAVMGLA
jgi:hypothetical protein